MEYKITRVEPRLDITPDGRITKIYRVYFKVGDIEDYIDVPEGQYSKAHVQKLVEERARTHIELLGA